jgi:hypothetical protein
LRATIVDLMEQSRAAESEPTRCPDFPPGSLGSDATMSNIGRIGIAGGATSLAGVAQTALRWREMQMSSTSLPSRFHQFSLEKISTSL